MSNSLLAEEMFLTFEFQNVQDYIIISPSNVLDYISTYIYVTSRENT